MHPPHPEHGFSLVELSIVLVILGLLVGGVLGGQSLIRAAELRSITTEADAFSAATYGFRAKYHALPGDMHNATAFWQASGNCASVQADAYTTPLTGSTCNGNRDGRITVNNDSARYEMFLFWHHLQLAGLIQGHYTGVRGNGANTHHIIGENAPASRFANGGWTAWTFDNTTGGNPTYFHIDHGNSFMLGANTAGHTNGKLLTPADAWSLDAKYDDGKPATGSVVVGRRIEDCTTASGGSAGTDLNATYDLTLHTVECALLFRHAF